MRDFEFATPRRRAKLRLMRRLCVVLFLGALCALGDTALARGGEERLWAGQAKLKLPAGAKTYRSDRNTWLYYPKGNDPGVMLIVLREKLRGKDRKARMKSVSQLLDQSLRREGWAVKKRKTRARDFQVFFRGRVERDSLPWLKQGQMVRARGQAKASRTRNGYLVVTVLLAEDAKWNRANTKAYREAFRTVKVGR